LMKKKPTQRHHWKYAKRFTLPRMGTPATCTQCGATHWYARRTRKRGYGRNYGPDTEDFVFQTAATGVLIAPKPVPPCVPRVTP